jgi:hypothetical protein
MSQYGYQFADMLTAVTFPVTALVSTTHFCSVTDSGVQPCCAAAVMMQHQLLYTFWLFLRLLCIVLSAEGEVMSLE